MVIHFDGSGLDLGEKSLKPNLVFPGKNGRKKGKREGIAGRAPLPQKSAAARTDFSTVGEKAKKNQGQGDFLPAPGF